MSDIKTLVDDIYKLFDDNNKEPTKSDLNMFAKNVCESIKTYLTEDNKNKPRKLRMSSLGKPARQLWYEFYRPDLREHLPPYVKIKFLYGHILEELLLLLARTIILKRLRLRVILILRLLSLRLLLIIISILLL